MTMHVSTVDITVSAVGVGVGLLFIILYQSILCGHTPLPSIPRRVDWVDRRELCEVLFVPHKYIRRYYNDHYRWV